MKKIVMKYFHFNIPALILLVLLAAAVFYHYFSVKTALSDINKYMVYVKAVESQIIGSIPIYSDFTTPQQESQLRKYLLSDHQKVAKIHGLTPVGSDIEMSKKIAQGLLISIDADALSPYFFYNVQDKYRFLTKSGASCLKIISERFQKNLNLRASVPHVKIAVSSAFRPVEYQKILSQKNDNAVLGSTHSSGISFDIFFDDYYVCLSEPECGSYISRIVLTKLRRDLGFLLGDALRRQFRSIFMETLLQLQEEKALYAILEVHQHCYHITSLIKN